MTDHTIFLEAHAVDDRARDIGMAVLCSCGAILAETTDFKAPQISLDEINIVRWSHYDLDIPHQEENCEVCDE